MLSGFLALVTLVFLVVILTRLMDLCENEGQAEPEVKIWK